MLRLNLSMATVLILCTAQAWAGPGFIDAFEVPAEATYMGSSECLDCHDEDSGVYDLSHTAHGYDRALRIPGTTVSGCEACHGPASLHIDEGGDGFILTAEMLADMDSDNKAAMCTQCHTEIGTHWMGGPHDGSEISCADCHGDMVHYTVDAKPAGDFRNRSEFCIQCHSDQVPDFRMPFRHRALEGQITCSDCHDAHRGFDTVAWNGMNDTCLECHTEMAGPFVFEHDGVSGENCTECHNPHGSNHDKMLIQEGNSLCMQCHYQGEFNGGGGWTIGDQAHSGLLMNEARCYDCHVDVHGSNLSPTFRNN